VVYQRPLSLDRKQKDDARKRAMKIPRDAQGVPEDTEAPQPSIEDVVYAAKMFGKRVPRVYKGSTGICNTCGESFQRNYPKQRKCKSCWESNKFKCSECDQVYERAAEARACPQCLPKLVDELQVSANLKESDELFAKLGFAEYLDPRRASFGRGSNLNAAIGESSSGASNSRIILASELSDRRGSVGDDQQDSDYEDNKQEYAEFSGHPEAEDLGLSDSKNPEAQPEEAKPDLAAELELPIPTEQVSEKSKPTNTLGGIDWFLIAPTGIIEAKTGLHRQQIHRLRERVRKGPAYVAAGTRAEIAKIMEGVDLTM